MSEEPNDFLNELGELALGSRLKRMSERMLADAASVYQYYGIDAQPKWFTLLALLDKKKTVSIVEAADLLGLSQPALSQFSRQLKSKGLIDVITYQQDSRKKHMQLSKNGKQVVNQMRPIWVAVEKAAKQMCEEFENQFYQSLQQLEKAHNRLSLLKRTQAFFETEKETTESEDNAITLFEYQPQYAPFFEFINSQWINDMFVLEDIDKKVLQQPQEYIIDKGGFIFFAEHQTLGIVGTCALMNKGNGAFELTKMGVLESARGLKIGEQLLNHVIKQAKYRQVKNLFLLTNAKCEAAIHLYEKNGFVHDTKIMEEFGACYERCDVAMRYCGGE